MKGKNKTELIRAAGFCGILFALFVLILTVIAVHRRYPDGKTDNPVFVRLLAGVSIDTVVADDRWRRAFPFDESPVALYERRVGQVEKSIENYCTTSFPRIGQIHSAVSFLKKHVYHFEIDLANEGYHVDTKARVLRAAEDTAAFSETLKQAGYPFLYVETPGEADTDITYFTETMEEAGVPVLRVTQEGSGPVHQDLSGHWFPEDALACALKIARTLNGTYGFGLDLSVFEEDAFEEYLERFPKQRAALTAETGYEYRMPVPRTDGDWSLSYAEEETWTGGFGDTFFRTPDLWKTGDAPYHDMLRITNGIKYDIINNANRETGKRVLVVGDSSSWPVCMYLAPALSELTLMYNPAFNGSILKYTEQMKPDMVLVIYSDSALFRNVIREAFDWR